MPNILVAKWTVAKASAASTKFFLEKLVADIPFEIEGIQVDGGLELMAEFESVCQQRKPKLYVLSPCMPQLNGGVERCNGAWHSKFYATTELLQPAHRRQDIYNFIRPHCALTDLTPAEYLAARKPRQRAPACGHILAVGGAVCYTDLGRCSRSLTRGRPCRKASRSFGDLARVGRVNGLITLFARYHVPLLATAASKSTVRSAVRLAGIEETAVYPSQRRPQSIFHWTSSAFAPLALVTAMIVIGGSSASASSCLEACQFGCLTTRERQQCQFDRDDRSTCASRLNHEACKSRCMSFCAREPQLNWMRPELKWRWPAPPA